MASAADLDGGPLDEAVVHPPQNKIRKTKTIFLSWVLKNLLPR